uniref:HAT C-terminal dimerisation domain-containing protein n=1 Tax=Latimeria chalumnae TaxID=7897 RepID=H3AZ56_LATCH
LLKNASTSQTQSITTLYIISLVIAKAKKNLSEGEFVKHCTIQMTQMFGNKKLAMNFKNVYLSHETVTKHVSDLFESTEEIIIVGGVFSLALDKNTDINDKLLIFVHVISNRFEVCEELLRIVSLHRTTKGVDIFTALKEMMDGYGSFGKLSCVVTDGALAMCGHSDGFIDLYKRSGVDFVSFHCIIHQESLCRKILVLKEVMDTVVKITNLIRSNSRSLSHRTFVTFLEEVDAEYGDLLFHTKVHWMSRGKCLEYFFSLRKRNRNTLQNTLLPTRASLKMLIFLCDLTFLMDISQHMIWLNVQLQGREKKLFPNSSLLCKVFRAILKEVFTKKVSFKKYNKHIQLLIGKFKDQFMNFYEHFFNNPLYSAGVEYKPAVLQLELCELQADDFLKYNSNVRGIDFWTLLSKGKFPNLWKWTLKMCSMFGSMYICENMISTMKLMKSKKRNRLTDDNLQHLL